MGRKQKAAQRAKPKMALRLLDLEQSKNAVLNSLPAPSSQGSYGHAIVWMAFHRSAPIGSTCNRRASTHPPV